MITVSTRRALLALATAAALLPAAPALAQTARDVTPPQLTSFFAAPTSVNVTAGPATVFFTACITDETGVQDPVVFTLTSNTTSQSRSAVGNLTSGTKQSGCYTGSVILNQGVAGGVYTGRVGGLVDELGNVNSTQDPIRPVSVTSGAPTTPPTTTPRTAPAPAPVPVPVNIDSKSSVIDYGDTVLVLAFGRIGARADLYGNGKLIRSGGILENQVGRTDGVYAWELQPGDATTFSAVVDGRRTKSIVVRVRRTASIGISQARGIYTFTGNIQRAEPGVQVTVARLDAATKRVTGVASAVTNAAGNYTIRTRLPIGQAGYYTLTGVTRTGSLLPGRSRLYGLIVPRPAPRPV